MWRLLPLAILACGPSFQAVYEGDVRFEHCYAVDDTPGTAATDRASCWRDYLKNYTYGQTKDRIEYASSRHYALTKGLEDTSADAGPRRARAPLPHSMHESPPNLIATEDGGADAGPAAVVVEAGTDAAPLKAPGADCTEECAVTWRTCKKDCKAKACEACDKTHKTCAMGCFTEPKKK
jgi:hypothetical protein